MFPPTLSIKHCESVGMYFPRLHAISSHWLELDEDVRSLLFSPAEEVFGVDTKHYERARRPTVWLRPAGGRGWVGIGLTGGTGGCCEAFPGRGRSAETQGPKERC